MAIFHCYVSSPEGICYDLLLKWYPPNDQRHMKTDSTTKMVEEWMVMPPPKCLLMFVGLVSPIQPMMIYKVAPNTPNTRGETWLIKWLNDQFPSLVAIIYIQWIGAIMIYLPKKVTCLKTNIAKDWGNT